MRKIIDAFLSTFSLISRIPIPGKEKQDFRYAGFFLPLTGLLIGVLCFFVFMLSYFSVVDKFLLTILILLLQYGLFNLFHFDGFLDSADALFCFVDKKRRLEILKDTSTGSFALFSGVVYLLLKIYLLFSLIKVISFSDLFPAVCLFAYPVSGRISASLIPCFLDPARETGLGVLLRGLKKRYSFSGAFISIFSVYAFSFPHLINGLAGISPFAGSAIAFFLVYILYRKKIGGYTGDAMGLAVETGELFHLLIFFFVYRSFTF